MLKKLALFILVPSLLVALGYEVQFENEQMRVAKVTIASGEMIGLHRDENPALVVGIKGGTITRLEANGSRTAVTFPTGEAVWRPTDPFVEPHRSVNNGSETVEILVIEFKNPLTLAH